jgi:hypothetical protein
MISSWLPFAMSLSKGCSLFLQEAQKKGLHGHLPCGAPIPDHLITFQPLLSMGKSWPGFPESFHRARNHGTVSPSPYGKKKQTGVLWNPRYLSAALREYKAKDAT